MLDSIVVRHVATYNEAGIRITGLKKINFIYGANGSGKTTITKYIDSKGDVCYADCSLNWANDIPIKALVYNKDFREKNFGNGKIDGVFTLGQATKEQIDEIAEMVKHLEEIKEKGIKKKTSVEALEKDITDLENEFRESAWTEIYKEYEGDFKQAFVGFQKKEAFKNKIIETYNSHSPETTTCDSLKEKAETIFGDMPTLIPRISYIDFSRIIEIEGDAIWKKKIIGKTDVSIAALVQRLNMNDGLIREEAICNRKMKPALFARRKPSQNNSGLNWKIILMKHSRMIRCGWVSS